MFNGMYKSFCANSIVEIETDTINVKIANEGKL